MAVAGFVLLTTGLAWFFESQATTTIIVTRHTDVLRNGGDDPGLSPLGIRRSQELARVLADIDVVAGLDAIYVAPNRRSRDTVIPLTRKSDVPVHTIDNPDDVETLVRNILSTYKGKIILIVTEAGNMQPVIAEMHGSKKLPEIAPREHDNIYIVSIPWFGKVKTLRLRYGDRYVPEA